MSTKQINDYSAKAYQILSNLIDPLEHNIHYFNITTTGYLQITTSLPDNPHHHPQLTVRETINYIKRAVTKSLTNHGRLILTSSPLTATFTIEDPSTYKGWLDRSHKGDGTIYIGIESTL